MGLTFNRITAAILGKLVTAVSFPALVNPPRLTVGDSMAAKDNFNLGLGSATLTRDGVTNLGRVTETLTNSGGNAQWGTPRVSLVNLTDTSFEVVGRNNYADNSTVGISIHTQSSDLLAPSSVAPTRIPSGNATSAATTTQALSNGFLINLERITHRGVGPHTNALLGGSMDVIANLGHPGALVGDGSGNLSVQAASELAYAKALCLATGTTVLIDWRMGINDIKPGATAATTFASAKKFLDGLTGLDGNGGTAVVSIRSCSSVGSAVSGYATLNEQVIGKCSTSNVAALNVDATLYGGVHTYNYLLWAYTVANPSKFLFVDCTSQSYDFTNHSTYDATFLDPSGNTETGDGTHYETTPCMVQGSREAAAWTAAGITFPIVVPRSAADATTPGGRTRIANRGPWTTTTVTTGFLTGGTGTNGVSTLLPKGGVAGQPTGWTCGRSGSGNTTSKWSVYDPGDSLGMWVNAEVSAGTANDVAVAYPWGSTGSSPAALGIGSVTDGAEYQFVFEVRWDGATAAGLVGVRATLQTNGGGQYGFATNGENGDDGIGMLDTSPAGNRKIATGWIQMSNSAIANIIPIITIIMGSITGVSCNVGIRCVGINKR